MNDLEALSILTGVLVICIELVILKRLIDHTRLLESHMKIFETTVKDLHENVESIYKRVCTPENLKEKTKKVK